MGQAAGGMALAQSPRDMCPACAGTSAGPQQRKPSEQAWWQQTFQMNVTCGLLWKLGSEATRFRLFSWGCARAAGAAIYAAALSHPAHGAAPLPALPLQAAVHAVQQHTPVSCSLEELYRAVEDMCLHKLAPKLYSLLQQECDRHSAQQV